MKARLDAIMDKLSEQTDATWSCYDCGGDCYEISTYSPAGENIIITICGGNLTALKEDANAAWVNFDKTEHAAAIFLAKRRGTPDEVRYYADAPDDLDALLEDAKEIDILYRALYYALRDAAQKEEE